MKIIINDVLGKVSWSLRGSHIVLFTFFCTFLRCMLKSNLVFNIIRKCFWLANLVFNIIRKCFWLDNDLIKFSLRYNRGWSVLLIFLLNFTSWACFSGSGLNLIFHWKTQLLIFIKSLFRSFAVEFIFWTTENREASSANSFRFEVKPSDKSLI